MNVEQVSDGEDALHRENVKYILWSVSAFPHVSKYSGKKRKRCSFAGGTKFSPFIARREPRKLFNLGLGGGLILWDASVTRVNGRFASNQPSYSSIYIKYSCEIQNKLINKQTKNSTENTTCPPDSPTRGWDLPYYFTLCLLHSACETNFLLY